VWVIIDRLGVVCCLRLFVCFVCFDSFDSFVVCCLLGCLGLIWVWLVGFGLCV